MLIRIDFGGEGVIFIFFSNFELYHTQKKKQIVQLNI